jgi:DNA-binding NarL/FixJ family response regulator
MPSRRSISRLASIGLLIVLALWLIATGCSDNRGEEEHKQEEEEEEEEDTRSAEEHRLTQIVIAEDHPLFREALRLTLSREAGLEVVGEAVDGIEALELCRRLQPELVLMDLGMPRMDGLEATRKIKSELPRTIVLVLTASVEVGSLSEALRAGASGYVLKDASPQQIIEAVRRVLRGESPLDQELATELLLRLMDEGLEEESTRSSAVSSPQRPSEERSEPALLKLLSPREIEVLRLVVQGQTNQEIAQNLLVSVSSVKKHMHDIITKLGVSDRVQAAVRAMELGLPPEQEGE